eukprot:4892142-Prymnesium_polylepis.1
MICTTCKNQIKSESSRSWFCAGPALQPAAAPQPRNIMQPSVQGPPIRYLARRRCVLQRTFAAAQQETRWGAA